MTAFTRMFITAALFVLATADEQVISVSSKVSSVKIHGNKAEVTRSLSVDKYKDDSYVTVRVDGLTNQLEDRSVRVKGLGRAEIIESTVSSRIVPRDAMPEYRLQMAFLQQLGDHLAGQSDAARASLQRAKAQKDYVEMYTRTSIDPNKRKPEDGTPAPALLPAQSMLEILAFQDSVAADMDTKIAAASRDLAASTARASAIQSSLEALRNRGIYTPYMVDGKLFCPETVDCSNPVVSAPASWPPSVASKSLEVRLRTAKGAAAEPLLLSFSYLAGPARWYPEYDIRLEGDAARANGEASRQYLIEVDYYAAVEQMTQEGWNGVQMSLSTTSPAEAVHHPQPLQRGVFYVEHSPHVHQEFLSQAVPQMMARGARPAMKRKRMKSESNERNDDTDTDEEDAGVAFMAAGVASDMAYRSAVVQRAGDLGASYQFQLQHPVNISSSDRSNGGALQELRSTGPRKLLVDTLKLKSTVFSYAVPSMDSRAFLRAWADLPKETSIPIIQSGVSQFQSLTGAGGASGGARIFIQGTYSGETSVDAVQPGDTMRLSLGQDKNLAVKNTPILAKHSNKEEDKSTWLTTDKSKFHVKTEEFALFAKSTHAGPMLVILAESIPVSTEEDIHIEILSPDPKSIASIDDSHSGGGDAALESIFAVVGREPPKDMQHDNKLHVFLSKETGNMYWARWLNPSETIVSTLKYKLTWPEKKNIVVA